MLVSEKYASHGFLMVDCYDWNSGYMHFSRRLTQLSLPEYELKGGRFHCYNSVIDSNHMEFTTPAIEPAFNNCLSWIYENCKSTWNFDVLLDKDATTAAPTYGTYKFRFFFERPADSVMFKLHLRYD